MKKMAACMVLVASSCNHRVSVIDQKHVASLAIDFMKTRVIPSMKNPKPYAIESATVIRKTAADKIEDYRFSYQHMSFNKEDSMVNKQLLDSVITATKNPDAVVDVTVNVAYKTKTIVGKIITDSIKLGYNPDKDIVTLWPF